MQKLKVLQVVMPKPDALWGVERHVALLSSKLREQGQDVLVFCPGGRKLLGLLKREDIPTASWRTNGRVDLISWFKLRELMKSEQIDLVHAHHHSSTFVWAGLASRSLRLPSLGSVHLFRNTFYFRFVDRLVAVSEALKDYLVTRGLDDGRVETIHCGVEVGEVCDGHQMREAKERLGIDPQETVVGSVGQLIPVKGYAHLLEATSRLFRKGYKFQVVVAGEGESRLELEGRAKELGIEDRVKLLGYREDAKEVMKAFDIFVMPSLKEALGIALLEAMALGKPVVGSRVGGIEEILRDGSGVLVEPGESEELAEAIEGLLVDEGKRERLEEAARRRVKDNFSSEIMAKKMNQLYQKLVA